MRLFKHLFAPFCPAPGSRRRDGGASPQAIADGELRHAGEICFAVEPALHWRARAARRGGTRTRRAGLRASCACGTPRPTPACCCTCCWPTTAWRSSPTAGLRGVDPGGLARGLRDDRSGPALRRSGQRDRARGSRRSPRCWPNTRRAWRDARIATNSPTSRASSNARCCTIGRRPPTDSTPCPT